MRFSSRFHVGMKGNDTKKPALESGGVASSCAPSGGVSHLAFPVLAREWNHFNASVPLASLGNQLMLRYIPLIE